MSQSITAKFFEIKHTFGSPLPGRTFSSPSYRYGFNGKLKDDEIKGGGASYDYGFRIYDSRVGRFLSVDPLTKAYPKLTPYQFSANNPIRFTDLDGLEANDPMPQYQDPVPNPQIANNNRGRNNNRFYDPQAGMGQRGDRPHYGLDILAPVNTPLNPVMDGKVVRTVNTFAPGQYAQDSPGNIIVVRGQDAAGNDVYIMYAHLNAVNVQVGDPVQAGVPIGETGNTGNARRIGAANYHVHIEASTTDRFYTGPGGGVGTRINPEQFLQTQFDAQGNPIPNAVADANAVTNVAPIFLPQIAPAVADNTQVAIPVVPLPPQANPAPPAAPANQQQPVIDAPFNVVHPQ